MKYSRVVICKSRFIAALFVPALFAHQEAEVRPILKQYCLPCHSAAHHTGDINLEEVPKDPRVWQKMTERLSTGEMPPKQMPQPSEDERARVIAWLKQSLSIAARAHAGDPGPVVLRRLNNAEYTFTVRDLTGLAAIEPAKQFPADGAAGEGFMNTGNSLVMSPSLITKYLDAGKAIASHAVLLPDGIRFSDGNSRRDWTNEMLTEIRAFYAKFTEAGGEETVKQQGIDLDKNRGGRLPLQRYLTASLELRSNTTSVDSVARSRNLSPKYLAELVTLLKGTHPSPLLDGLRARWRRARASDIPAMVSDIERWQNTLWTFSSVGHIGKADGPRAWMEPVDPVVEEQHFRVPLSAPSSGSAMTVYLTSHDAGDGSAGDIVLWREPKLEIPGREPVLLRDVPGLVQELTHRRTQIFAATAKALTAAEESAEPSDLATRAWFHFLGVQSSKTFALDLLKDKIQKSGTYDFVQGWGSDQLPMVLANSSNQNVRVPGNMKAHGIGLHPSKTLKTAIGWLSPVSGAMQIDGVVKRSHAECGTGVTWALELRRGNTRQQLANGEARGAKPASFQSKVRVQPGDLISVVIGPREANQACALTDVELRLNGPAGTWSLTNDVAGNVLAGNPHADNAGHAGIWNFYTEPVDGVKGDTVLPAGSLLARWQISDNPGERKQLAQDLDKLLTSPTPSASDKTSDAALYRQLHSLAAPLFAAEMSTPTLTRSTEWALPAAAFGQCPNGVATEPASLCTHAPSVIAVRLPADLAAGSEFVTTGTLDKGAGAEASVQLEVLTTKPEPRNGLLLAGTAVGDANGQWSSNNQTVSYAMPVVVRKDSAGRKRVERTFDEFRQMFPAALCYTKIVPVDEVVTLTQFYREDDHLSRLILNNEQKAKLDHLWDELHYISRDALTQVDAFEQLWQYATQDADPSKFEPLRKPIQERAAAFKQRLLDTEPRHVEAVLQFADRAYRRPLTEAEQKQLRDLYAQLRKQELPHEDAIRLMLARVFVAPAFLYRSERVGPGKQASMLGDYELANRLSYFLWSSMPDPQLRAAAAAGRLRTAEGIQVQTHRMLQDTAKLRRLSTEFGAAWLHVHGFDELDEKSEHYFPEFRALRAAMYEETIRYFTDFFANNGSVLSLLDADHTFVNGELAKHYGIPGVEGAEWRRVDGVKQYARGGILAQAAVLAQQSGASRTSPILRGAWIQEVILGDKLPRPPKDVPQLPTDEATETFTVRELTERHTKDARCSVCHSRIDPFGYPLEGFDAIGRHREKDLGNRAINDRSTLKDGTPIAGFEGLKEYLLTKGRQPFVRQFCRKLLGYSLGRAVQLSDEPLLEQMQTTLAANDYRVGNLIDMIVTSHQFREIRGRDYDPEQQQ